MYSGAHGDPHEALPTSPLLREAPEEAPAQGLTCRWPTIAIRQCCPPIFCGRGCRGLWGQGHGLGPSCSLLPSQIMTALEANPTARRTQLQHKFEQVVALMEDNIYECYSEA